jgi:DNA-binding CsgD family transcriptional regulator
MVENSAASAQWPLRGRRRELDVLEGSLHALAHGRGGAILITGAAGSGKSSLLERALASARRDGLRCLTATAAAAERGTMFTPLLDALAGPDRPVLDAARLRALAARGRGLPSAMEEIGHRVTKAAAWTPLVIAIDALHHADDATVVALRTWAARTPRTLWLMASAPDSRAVSALTGTGVQTLNLAPLDAGATRALAADVLHAIPAEAVLEVIDDLGGHPSSVVELLRALIDEDLIDVSEGVARLRGRGLRHALCKRGVRRAERVPDAGSQLGLTRSELAVAELVARGATNRQAADQLYLSPHTVSTHLRHTFEKLGIRSRVELAVLFSQALAS